MSCSDGDSDAFVYICNNNPIQYCFVQAFKANTHFTHEIIKDIQIEGLNPGDSVCIINKVGEAIYTKGVIVAQDNVPEVDTNIYTINDYYDENAIDVW